MTIASRHIVSAMILLLAAACVARAKDPKIATKLNRDSTIFKLELVHREKLVAGKSFEVRIHVTPKENFHIWSSKMDDMGGLIPLKVVVPDSIADYFELTGFEEVSQPEVLYDSNFEQVTKSNYRPFDLIATIKARKNTTSSVPFYLLVTYQTCHGKTECFPPARFAVPMNVIGDQPLKLDIAGLLKSITGRELAVRYDSR